LEELAKGNMPVFMEWKEKHEPEVVMPIYEKVGFLETSQKFLKASSKVVLYM
jgi:hypothetical protein